MTMRYLNEIPTKQPDNFRVIFHNHVVSKRLETEDGPVGSDRIPGEGGFRAWTDDPGDRLEECTCGWSGLRHYRIKKPLG